MTLRTANSAPTSLVVPNLTSGTSSRREIALAEARSSIPSLIFVAGFCDALTGRGVEIVNSSVSACTLASISVLDLVGACAVIGGTVTSAS